MYPVWLANQACLMDAITTAIDQLSNVYDNACLTGLEIVKPATTAVTYSGKLSLCAE
jgi:Na+-translocating ferredoxin:NAD+ oxidoreductase RNF subunit RnfB